MTLILALLISAALTLPAMARGLIRDADIEYALAELARPLIAAAGLNPSRIKILVIHDDRPNAFVVDDRHVFINSGMILRLGDAAELQSVMAHEIAHIANGHLTRRMANRQSAGLVSAIAIALGAAVAASTGDAKAGAGIAIGATNSANRQFLAHTRAEEAAADLSAIRYLQGNGIDAGGMVRVLDMFRGQEALSTSRQDPYVRAHPLTRDRLRNVKGHAAAQTRKTDPATANYWFLRAQGKLGAWLRKSSWTLRRVKNSDTSDIAIMRRAVAYHRQPNAAKAIAEADRLVAKRPKDPFLHELRGQILLESRQFSAAANAYSRAVNLAPNNALILAGYGRALLADDTAAGNKRALGILEKARSRDPRDARMMRDLALAYARAGNNGMASLATAERYALQGRLEDAGIHAERASGLLARGSPGWRRAQDVLSASKAASKRRSRG
jgi:predicted Zn-dependent protease